MFSKVSILTARKGEVISLIGSSGSGKSTMLRCANLLEHAQSGIIIEGEVVQWQSSGDERQPASQQQVIDIRTHLAMVFQQFNLCPI